MSYSFTVITPSEVADNLPIPSDGEVSGTISYVNNQIKTRFTNGIAQVRMTDIAEYIRVVVKPLYVTAGWTIVETNVADSNPSLGSEIYWTVTKT